MRDKRREERKQSDRRFHQGSRRLANRILSLVLSLAMFVSLFTGIELTAEASYSCYNWGTNRNGANITLNSTYACEKIPIQMSTSGVYRFYSTDKQSGDPYVYLVSASNVNTVVNSCINNGGRNSTAASYSIGYNDDGGGSLNYCLYAYLEAGVTYYIVCTRYASSGNCYYYARYQYMGNSTVTLNNQSANTTGTSYLYGGKAGYSICNSANYYASTSSASSYINTPSKSGYQFGGYYTSPNGSGTQCISNSGYIYQGNLRSALPNGGTLYAKWTPITTQITFNANKAQTSQLSPNTGVAGTTGVSVQYTKSMPAITVPTMDGYTFLGYFDTSNKQYYAADGTAVRTWDKTASAATLTAHWSKNTYTATLNANGGSGGSGTVEMTFESELPSNGLSKPARGGYSFDGFYYNDKQYYDSTMQPSVTQWDRTADTTLKAKWSPVTYNIEIFSNDDIFNADGGSGYVTTISSTYGRLVLPTAESLGLSREHYDFVGWNVYDEQDWAMYMPNTVYRTGLSEEAGKHVTIYAAWKIKDNCSIVYNANGGIGGPLNGSVFKNDTYVIPEEIPTYEGYTFIGWDRAPSGTSEHKYLHGDAEYGSFVADSNVTLYACWVKNNKVSYNANGGSFKSVISNLYPASGAAVEVTLDEEDIPERTGYKFLGWAKDANAQTPDYTENGTTSFVMGDTDIILYAVWEKETYQITFDASECSDCTQDMVIPQNGTAKYEDNYTFRIKMDPKAVNVQGLTVTVNDVVYTNTLEASDENDGWYTYKYTINKVASNQEVRIIGLTRQQYQITYDMNGGIFGSGDDAQQSGYTPIYTYTYSDSDAATLTGVPEKRGYTFDGWYTSDAFEGAAWTEIPARTAGDITFYAKWKVNSYRVVFDGIGNAEGGSAGGSIADITTDYDENIVLPDQGNLTYTLGDNHYTLLGWYSERTVDDRDGDGEGASDTSTQSVIERTDYHLGETVRNLATGTTGDNEIVLHANWNVPNYRVTYDLNGGTGTGYAAVSHKAGTDVELKFTELARTGYQFTGWKDSATGTVYTVSGVHTISGIAKDYTLTAEWQPVSYTVKYQIPVADGYALKKSDGSSVAGPGSVPMDSANHTYDDSFRTPALPSGYELEDTVLAGYHTTYEEKKTELEHLNAEKSTAESLLSQLREQQKTAQDELQSYVDANITPKQDVLDERTEACSAAEQELAECTNKLNQAVSDLQDAEAKLADARAAYNAKCVEADKDKEPAEDNYSSGDVTYAEVKALYDAWQSADTTERQKQEALSEANDKKAEAQNKLSVAEADKRSAEADLEAERNQQTYKDKVNAASTAEQNTNQKQQEIDTITEAITRTEGERDAAKAAYDARLEQSATKFLGWSKAEDASEPEYVANQMVSNLSAENQATVTLYAVFGNRELNYITYDLNGGLEGDAGSSAFAPAVITGDHVTLPDEVPTRRFYDFEGWKKTDGDEALYQAGAQMAVTGSSSITMQAQWKIKQYTITYHSNVWDTTYGNEYETESTYQQKIDYEKTEKLAGNTFTRDYYDFKGWLDTPSSNSIPLYRDKEEVKNLGDHSLYAVWTLKDPVRISFNANGGDGAPESVSVPKGYPAAIPTDIPLREGYDLVGWNDRADTDGVTEENILYRAVYDGDTVTGYVRTVDGAEVHTLDTSRSMTLFAVWKEKDKYRVEYRAAEGSSGSAPSDTSDYYPGNEINVDFSLKPVKAGYQFAGWKNGETTYTEDGERRLYVPSSSLEEEQKQAAVSGNRIYFDEVLQPNTYSVEFFKGDESKGTIEGFVYDAEEFTESQQEALTHIQSGLEASETNYEFAGWSTVQDGPVVYEKDKFFSNLTAVKDGHVNLYAVMEAKKYLLTFANDNGDTPTSANSIYATYGDWVPAIGQIISTQPVKYGYDFAGYYKVAEDGSLTEEQYYDENLNPQVRFTASANVTLKAKWTPKKYRIIYTYNGENMLIRDTEYLKASDVPGSNILPDGTIVTGATKLYGWSVSGTKFKEGTENTTREPETVYKAGTKVDFWSAAQGYDLILRPIIIRDAKYTVTYNANGGTGFPVDTTEYEDGEICTVKFDNIPKRTDYDFLGWSTDPFATEPMYAVENRDDNSANPDESEYNPLSQMYMEKNVTLYAVWAASSYEIVYKSNYAKAERLTDADGNLLPNSQRVYCGPDMEGSPRKHLGRIYAMEGYDLMGWSTSSSKYNGVTYEPDEIITQTLSNQSPYTLYTVWQAREYTVSFDAGYDDASALADIVVTYDSRYGELPKPERAGYVFDGWYLTSGDSSERITSSSVVQTAANHTLTAKWIDDTYMVNYKPNQFAVQNHAKLITDSQDDESQTPAFRSITVRRNVNGSRHLEESYQMTGYEQIGWSTSYFSNNTANYTFGEEIVEPLTAGSAINLYTVWEAKDIEVDFDANMPDAEPIESMKVVYNNRFGTLPVPERKGYTFEGWYAVYHAASTDEAGNEIAENYAEPVTASTLVNVDNVTAAATDKITLHAVWSKDSFSVTYHPNYTGAEKAVTYHYSLTGDTVLPGADIFAARKGYTLEGFAVSPRGAATYAAGENVGSEWGEKDAQIDLYGVWKADRYTVRFDSQGGSAEDDIHVTYDELYGTLPAVTRENYEFAGWYLDKECSDDKLVTRNTLVRTAADHTLYAKWKALPLIYTINYHANGGVGDMQPQKMTVGVKDAIYVNTFSRQGYLFAGWTTIQGSRQVEYADGQEVLDLAEVNGAEVELYAVWESTKVTVTLEDGTEVRYETLEEALAYAQAGGVQKISLGADLTVSKSCELAKDIVLELNGNKLLFTGNAVLTNRGTIDAGHGTIDGIGSITNNGTIKNGVLNLEVNNTNGLIKDSTIALAGNVSGGDYDTVVINGTLTGGTVSGNSINNGVAEDIDITGTVTNKGVIRDSYVRPTQANNGTVSGNRIVLTSEGIDTVLKKTDTTAGDVMDSVYADLKLTAKGSKNSVRLSWKRVEGAEGYLIFGAKIDGTMERIDELNRRKSSYVVQDLENAAFYKFVVVAYHTYDGKKVIFSASKVVQTGTKGLKNATVKGFRAKAQKTKLQLGETTTISSSVKGTFAVENHVAFARFESEDPNIAAVNDKGEVTAVRRGKATIYVIMPDGKAKKIKITVK